MVANAQDRATKTDNLTGWNGPTIRLPSLAGGRRPLMTRGQESGRGRGPVVIEQPTPPPDWRQPARADLTMTCYVEAGSFLTPRHEKCKGVSSAGRTCLCFCHVDPTVPRPRLR